MTIKSENGTKMVDGKRICVVFGRGLSHDLPPTLSGAARKNRFAGEKVLLVMPNQRCAGHVSNRFHDYSIQTFFTMIWEGKRNDHPADVQTSNRLVFSNLNVTLSGQDLLRSGLWWLWCLWPQPFIVALQSMWNWQIDARNWVMSRSR